VRAIEAAVEAELEEGMRLTRSALDLSVAPSTSIVTATLPAPRDLGSAKARARRRLPF